MKIKIDGEGGLWLERCGVMKAQICPFHSPVLGAKMYRYNCGDWCPKFFEGHIDNIALVILQCNSPTRYELPIQNFKDERGGSKW